MDPLPLERPPGQTTLINYLSARPLRRAFVVSEANGVWGSAQHVAAARDTGGDAEVYSVSCAAAGNCTAGGYYDTLNPSSQPAFVVTETNGTWGTAQKVAAGRVAVINSVSCAAAGNCTADGYYTDSSGKAQAFGVSSRNGAWAAAQEIPGSGTLNKGGYVKIDSVSCAAAGN